MPLRLRRITIGFLAACAACGGGDGAGTGPRSVSAVSITGALSVVETGKQITLGFTAVDASGNSVTGRTATWTTSAASVATVDAAGVVTGVAAGNVTITATVDGKSGSRAIVVTNPGATSCTQPLALQLGEVRTLSGAERSNVCFPSSAAATEYLIVAINNSLDTTGQTLAVKFESNGTTQVVGPPSAIEADRMSLPAAAGFAAGAAGLATQPRAPRDRAFHLDLRARERAELAPRLRRPGAAMQAPVGVADPNARGGALRGVTGVPAVGTLVTLNTRSNSACSNFQFNTGRVVAVSNAAIIIADTLAPAGGFTTQEYEAFGTAFDTLVHPVDTTAFGAPSDMDGNGRIVIFFTQAVNQLTAAGAQSVIGGFFFARDLFPVNTNANFIGCAGSNEAEMFYLPVVDPQSQYNGFFRNKTTMLTDMIATLAHEYQHLINAGRRAYVNDADDFETVWLNEGLSHLAEELLYFRAAGISPRSDLGLSQITANAQRTEAINAYQLDNLFRLVSYLQAPQSNSPYKRDDALATRGATWQFLRYAVDRGTSAEPTYLRALVNAKTSGMANLSAAIGPIFSGGITTGFRTWAVAQFVDNLGLTNDPQYAMASWNFRSVIVDNVFGTSGFPLKPSSLIGGAAQNATLVGGAVLYLRFRVAANTAANVIPTVPGAVDVAIVRTQ